MDAARYVFFFSQRVSPRDNKFPDTLTNAAGAERIGPNITRCPAVNHALRNQPSSSISCSLSFPFLSSFLSPAIARARAKGATQKSSISSDFFTCSRVTTYGFARKVRGEKNSRSGIIPRSHRNPTRRFNPRLLRLSPGPKYPGRRVTDGSRFYPDE